ncbi:hypothetical protein WA1_27665 [Scytonema hofmannii PCC 7110]|uniref:Orc1-like AAA ATPase domain-containing protein n=1 Tax=Scytonema hofmannii PCC 7110 TaxID=128403 RepID=A0A139X6G8_9CYAN|nr:hypothetical protein [Scytonema hofmannii]KYC40311.1 hypothetical protein WA1_27665 [Scytonema hofmannii PCC 7110]
MAQETAILRRLFNAFDPSRPLPDGDPLYVDCQEVRGDGDIKEEIGREILYSNSMTYQIYAGHRGAGKSTELLRLQRYLDNYGCYVVYFAADDQDIEPEDAEYTDILLACTRHLLESLRNIARPEPLLKWLREQWEDLKDLLSTPVSLETLEVETLILSRQLKT